MTISSTTAQTLAQVGVVFEVFGNKLAGVTSSVTLVARRLIDNYLDKEERMLIRQYSWFYNCPLPVQVELHKRDVCTSLLHQDFRTEQHENILGALFSRVLNGGAFSAEPRKAENRRFGFSYPVEPEALAYAMSKVKDEIVVELAGGSGALSIILAMAGAKHVYMNEIEQQEVETFKDYHYQCPPNLQERLTPIHGDCLKLLQLKPELTGKVGFVLCRNLLHFPQVQLQPFFAMLKKMMRPDGEAIFVVGAPYTYPESQKEVEQHPDETCFAATTCTLSADLLAREDLGVVLKRLKPSSEAQMRTEITHHDLYTRDGQNAWQFDRAAFNRVEPSLRADVEAAIKKARKEHKEEMAQAKRISVEIHHQRCYSTRTITQLFQKNGFTVMGTFIADALGHRITGEFYPNGRGVGVMVAINPSPK